VAESPVPARNASREEAGRGDDGGQIYFIENNVSHVGCLNALLGDQFIRVLPHRSACRLPLFRRRAFIRAAEVGGPGFR
jgi:hypothetical protein